MDQPAISIHQKGAEDVWPTDRYYFCEPSGGPWGCRTSTIKTPYGDEEGGTLSQAKPITPKPESPEKSPSPGKAGYEKAPITTVHFDFDSDALNADASVELERVLNAGLGGVLAEGYTDGIGAQAYNNLLALRRARAVKEYLISKGFPASAISVGGRGLCCYVASNKTDTGRGANRRVDIYPAK